LTGEIISVSWLVQLFRRAYLSWKKNWRRNVQLAPR